MIPSLLNLSHGQNSYMQKWSNLQKLSENRMKTKQQQGYIHSSMSFDVLWKSFGTYFYPLPDLWFGV